MECRLSQATLLESHRAEAKQGSKTNRPRLPTLLLPGQALARGRKFLEALLRSPEHQPGATQQNLGPRCQGLSLGSALFNPGCWPRESNQSWPLAVEIQVFFWKGWPRGHYQSWPLAVEIKVFFGRVHGKGAVFAFCEKAPPPPRPVDVSSKRKLRTSRLEM